MLKNRAVFVLGRGMILDALTSLHLLDLPSLGLERFDTWDHISLQGVNLDVLLVMRNVFFIEPQMLFLGKSVDLFRKKC